jgi:nucleoside-diphosphate kinase
MLEVTVGIVKPHAYKDRRKIKEMIEGIGLSIAYERDPYCFDVELAKLHYALIENKPWYKEAIDVMVDKNPGHEPTAAYLIVGEDAVNRLAELVGDKDPQKARPGTIRHGFGRDIGYNAFHRADSLESVIREVNLHFPKDEVPENVLEILKGHEAELSVPCEEPVSSLA